MVPEVDSKLLRRRPNNHVALSDFDLDAPFVAKARRRLRSGDFGPAIELLEGSTDVNELFHIVHSFADWDLEADFLQHWVSQSSSGIANTIWLIYRTKRTWDLGPWTPTKTDYVGLRDGLEQLKDEFLALAKRERNSALMMPHFMWVLRGLSDPDTARKVFLEGVRRQPDLRAVYSSGMTTEGPQWFGESADSVRDFIDTWLPRAPNGIGIETLEFMAAWYRSLGTPGDPREAGVWQDIGTRHRLGEAIERAESAGLSGHNGARTRHFIAHALYCMGEHDRAGTHLRELGPEGAECPWGRLRFGLTAIFSMYKKARKACRA